MANAIKIKRSAGEIGSNVAAAGELMWVDGSTSGGTTGALYIGDMTSSGASPATIKIGGPSFETDILHNSTFTGITKVDAPLYAHGYTADDKVTDTKFVLDAIADSGVPINAASDTLIPDTAANAAAVATGSALVYNGTVWQNRSLSGHVAMDGLGDTVVSGFATGQLDLADATTSSYVSTVIGTANEISVKINNAEATVGTHTATSALTLGFTAETVIPGNLTVSGTTTTVDTATVSLADSMFVIGTAGATVDSLDRGIEFKTGTS